MTATQNETQWILTDDAKSQIPAWNERWMRDVILRTSPLTDGEKSLVKNSIIEMYRLVKKSDVRVVFVSSPLQAAIVSGAAAAWWYAATDAATHDATDDATDDATRAATYAATYAATHDATDDATRAATYAATRAATYDATHDATYAATDAATYAATRAATYDATRAATRAATYDATRAATYDATYAATYDATDDATRAATDAATLFQSYLLAAMSATGDTPIIRSCVAKSRNMRNGGNQWATWCCYLSFVRDVVGWKHQSHSAYAHYENAAIAGPRYIHEKFCVISDLPTVLAGYWRDGVFTSHCDDGPSHQWADGWSLWHIDGVSVDEQIVVRPETQTVAEIAAEQNEEVRRIRIERFGWPRYLSESGSKAVDQRTNDVDGTRESLMRLKDGSLRLLCACRSTARVYAVGVPREIKTCEQAQAWMAGGSKFAGKKFNLIGAS